MRVRVAGMEGVDLVAELVAGLVASWSAVATGSG
jgi:hypothetical protein